jgi:3-hexulose-6-phosphate synthase/6-phospho-3-hexuloisomerase
MKKVIKMPVLQLALDFDNLDEAMDAVDSVVKFIDWVEVGTPLIKSEGLIAIEEVKKCCPGLFVVADMKTMDAGAMEVALAAEAGAHATTVCAAASDETIKAAIAEGRKRKIKVIVDAMNTPPARWKEIDSMQPDYIAIHVGLDQQKAGLDPISLLGSQKLRTPLAVAGGLDSKRVYAALKAGAEVVVVGAAITKAQHPVRVAKEINEIMDKASKEILLYGRDTK